MALQSGSELELPKKLEKPGDQTSLPLGLDLGLLVIIPAMLPHNVLTTIPSRRASKAKSNGESLV